MNLGENRVASRSSSNVERGLRRVLSLLLAAGLLAPAAVSAAGNDLVPPRLTRPVDPVYPSDLRDAGVEGQVEVLFEVDNKGFVRDPEIGFASHRDFGESVKVAVEKWRFSPARRAGIAVSQRVRVPVVFVVKANDLISKWAGRNVFRRTQSQPVEADELDEWPQPIAWIEPYYPPSLAGTGQRAEIVVSFVVDEHGEVINPEVLIGDDPHFIASALAAAVSLRFTPQLNAEGDPVPVLMAVSYKFDEKKQQQWERAVAPPRNGSF